MLSPSKTKFYCAKLHLSIMLTLAVEQNTLESAYIPVNQRKLVPEQHLCASIQGSTGITCSLMAGGLPNSRSSPKNPLLAVDGELLQVCAALTV